MRLERDLLDYDHNDKIGMFSYFFSPYTGYIVKLVNVLSTFLCSFSEELVVVLLVSSPLSSHDLDGSLTRERETENMCIDKSSFYILAFVFL